MMAEEKDPFAEFGGKSISNQSDPFAEFGGKSLKKKAVSQPGGFGSQLGSQNFQGISGTAPAPLIGKAAEEYSPITPKQKKLSESLNKAKEVYESVQGTPLAELVQKLPVYESVAKQADKDTHPVMNGVNALAYIASGFNKGLENIAQGAAQPLARAGLIPGVTADTAEAAISQAAQPFSTSKEQEEKYGNKPFLSQLHGLAEFLPASIGAASTGGATFFLNGYGNRLNEVKKLEREGQKFENGADDVYAVGGALIDWALMSALNSHTIFSKFPQALRDDVVSKLSMDALGDVGKLGANAGADDVLNLFKKKALDFDTKLRQLGSNYIKSYLGTAADLTALNAANYNLGKIANNISDKNIFKQTPEELLNSTKDILTMEAPIFAAFGAVKDAGQLFRKSPYTNEVISNLYKDSSPENVDRIKQQLATHLESKELTPDEIQKSVNQVDKLATIAKTLPANGALTEEKFKQGIELIDGREQLREQLNNIKASKEGLDESVKDIPHPEEQLITAKLEQANDKLKELAAGGKYKYDFDPIKDVYTKQLKDGPVEEISKERFDLEGLEKAFARETEISRKIKADQEKLNDFVDRIIAGEDMSSPEDLQFYNNNKSDIETKLKENAIQEQSTGGEVPPVTEGGENLQENGTRMGQGEQGVETTEAPKTKEEVTATNTEVPVEGVKTIKLEVNNDLANNGIGLRAVQNPDGKFTIHQEIGGKVFGKSLGRSFDTAEELLIQYNDNIKDKLTAQDIQKAQAKAQQVAKEEANAEQPFKDIIIKPNPEAVPEATIPGLEKEGEQPIFESKKYKDAKEVLETKGDVISDAKKKQMQDIVDAGDEVLIKEINKKTKKLESLDTNKIPEEHKGTFDAILNIDKENLTSDQLLQLNEMIDKFDETGQLFDKGNTIEDLYKIQKSATPETMEVIKKNSLDVSRFVEAMKDFRTFSTKIQAVTTDEHAAAVIRVFTGMGEHNKQYGSMKGFEGAMDRTFNKFSTLLAKTKVDESLESQLKIGAVNDIVQHAVDMTPEQAMLEFNGRKKALVDGIAEGRKQMEASRKYTREHGAYIEMLEKVYNKYVKDAESPEELIKTLTKGEAQVRDFMLAEFQSMKEGLNNLSKIYKGKAFDDVKEYFPRMYVRPDVMNPKAGKAVKEVAGNLTDISDFASESPEMKLDKSRSTAFDERTLEQDMLPEEKLVNYNSLDVFQDNYRKQAYDLHTMKSRSYMSKVLNSPEFLEALGGDKDLLGYYQDAFIQRIQNEKSSLRRGDESDVLGDAVKFARSTGNRIALGGIGTPYAKQFAPTMASLMINTGDSPQAMFTAVQNIIKNNKAFHEIIDASPVSRRHNQEAQFLNGRVNANDVKTLNNAFRKKLKGWDTKMDKTFMTALKMGDQTSAGISYLTYYMKSCMDRGKYKKYSDFDMEYEAKHLDPIAQQYAEQMTSTTLNVNEGVDRAAKQIGGGWLPFVSFAVNSKANFVINAGKLVGARGAISGEQRVEAAQRLAANVAEIYAINFISSWQRQLFIAGSGAALKALIGATSGDQDDEKKVKLLELVNTYTKQAIEKNNKNVNKYITQDLLSGQIAGNYTDKMQEDLIDVYGQASAALTGKEPTRAPRTFRKYEIFKLMGVYGIPIVNGFEGIINLSKFAEPSSVYRQQKFGYIDPYDHIKIQEGKEDFKRPSWARYSQGAVGLANLMSLAGGSFAEVSAITRRLPQITGGMEKELYGNDRNLESKFLIDQKSPYKYTRLQDSHATIRVGGEYYYLNPSQLKEWTKFKADALSEVTKQDRLDLIANYKEAGYPDAAKRADNDINTFANRQAREYILEKYIDNNDNILLDKKNEVKKK